MTEKLKTLLGEYEQAVRAAEALLKEVGDSPNEEQVTSLVAAREAITTKGAEVEAEEKVAGATEGIRSAVATLDKGRGAAVRPALYGGNDPNDPDAPKEVLTPGESYLRSEAYEAWMKQFPDGGPTPGTQGSITGLAAQVPSDTLRAIMGLRTASEKLRGILTPDRMRALVTSADASVGTLIRPEFLGLLEPGLLRPLTIRQLVTVMQVSTDSIEYVREASRISGAAPVAEATALTGTSGTKPEGGLTFAVVSDLVRTIAEWVPATRRVLQDAPQLRAYIDQYLTDDLALELEDQMIAGNGTGENFLGILNTPGIQTAGPPAGSVNVFDVLRTAKRLIRVNGRTNPTAVVMNPADAETVDTLKTSQGIYYGSGPFGPGSIPPSIWGVPTVESEAIPAGFALMGDFRRAVLFDREQTTITTGTVNDDFIRNIIRILAEMRAGFGVLRPAAFCYVDLVA